MNHYKIGDVVLDKNNKEYTVTHNDGYKINTIIGDSILLINIKEKVGIMLMNGNVSYRKKKNENKK